MSATIYIVTDGEEARACFSGADVLPAIAELYRPGDIDVYRLDPDRTWSNATDHFREALALLTSEANPGIDPDFWPAPVRAFIGDLVVGYSRRFHKEGTP